MRDQRHHAAEASPIQPSSSASATRLPGLEPAGDLEGERAAEVAELSRRDLVLRMLRQTRVVDALDGRVRRQRLGQLRRGGAVVLHPQAERRQAPEAQPRLERGIEPPRSITVSRSRRNSSSLVHATPPIRSACPPTYFVAEWSATSKPSATGLQRYGDANVLSTAERTPASRQREARAARSGTVVVGFTIVSQ